MNQFNQTQPFTIQKELLAYIGFWFIIPFCSFTSHTVVLIPPTLILFLTGTGALMMLLADSGKVYNIRVVVLPLLFMIYVMISQITLGAPFAHYMGVVFAIAYFVIVVLFVPYLSGDRRDRLVEKFILFTVMLLIVECIWRFTHPDPAYKEFAATGDPRWIYQYKMIGLMYIDSNSTAIHIVILFFFLLYRESEGSGKYKWAKLILLVLLVLTISRAAWFGAAVGWVYFRYLYGRKIPSYMLNLILLSLGAVLFYVFFIEARIKDDISYNTKFEIVTVAIDYMKKAPALNLFFGQGFSKSLDVLDIYAHNFLLVFLIESGIAGLVFMIVLLIQFVVTTRRKALIILVPFILTTLSASMTFIPYLYVVMALVYIDQQQRHQSAYES
jgi:hypothetical protein